MCSQSKSPLDLRKDKCSVSVLEIPLYFMVLFLFFFFFIQLDPQMLQGKDWQRTVIPMNGVSVSTSAPLL